MGTALVIPTNEVKMLIPRTAASLQRALRKPNAVVLGGERERELGVKARVVQPQGKSSGLAGGFPSTLSVNLVRGCSDHKGPQGGAIACKMKLPLPLTYIL